MSLPHPTKLGCFISCRSEAVKLDRGQGSVNKSDTGILLYDNGSKERIKKMFKKADLLVSSYDTAWMAMVPTSANPHHQTTPQFPSCLNWVLNNQLSDGSWGLCDRDTTLTMDAISSTLACVVALKQWGTGERQINMGLEFVATNSSFLNDDKQRKPIGFDITFPSMIDQANSLNLNVPIRQGDLDALFKRRNVELASSDVVFTEGRRAYLSYVSEGVGIYQDWQMAMKYQRKNGSLLNSPSATAAAFSHLRDEDCLRYLNLLLDTFGGAVPAIYPLGIYTRLWMVDNLERLGIHHHFKEEIDIVLEETYRWWLRGEEEIFEDMATCAMAFRLLRLHGYDVSSDALRQFAVEDHFRNTLEGYLGQIGPVLELYKASQIIIYDDEVILEDISSWTCSFLRKIQLIGCPKHAEEQGFEKHLSKEVDNVLRFPYHADMKRLGNMRNIEHYKDNLYNTRMLKSAVRSYAIGNKDFLDLAVEDFNKCQLIYQEELKDLERWVVEKRLDKLKFARQKQAYCYLAAVDAMPIPELSDARLSWAKNAVLTTVIDDLYDIGGSQEELDNFMQLLINKYRGHNENNISTCTEEFCSENVEILYSALTSTISEVCDKAFAWQGRCVMSHATKIWLDLIKSFLREAEWSRKKSVPTIDEYVANASCSFALEPIVVLTLYFMGPQLSEDAVQSPQIQKLYELMSTCARLLNDVQSYKREYEQGKLNAVTLQMIHSGRGGAAGEEEAIKRIKDVISSKTRELLRCVLEEEKGSSSSSSSVSVIPRDCRDLFWKMNAVNHLFYMEEDGFTSLKLMDAVKTLFQQPIVSIQQP